MSVGKYYKCLNTLSVLPEPRLCHSIFPRKQGYVFQSSVWEQLNLHTVELTRVPLYTPFPTIMQY